MVLRVVGEGFQRLVKSAVGAAGEVEGLVAQLLPDLPQAADVGVEHR